MNVADFFIGMGTGILVPIIGVCFIYLSVKRIITRDPKIVMKFALKHIGGKPSDKSEPATSLYPTWPAGFPSTTQGESSRPTSSNSGSGFFGNSL